MLETICLKYNSKGGKKVSVIKTGNYYLDKEMQDTCLRKSKGLYIWTYINNIDFIKTEDIDPDNYKYMLYENDHGIFIHKSWIKPGQYGQNAVSGISPVDTIDGYTSGQYDEIVILKVYDDLENPYDIEQKSWHQNAIFHTRRTIDGGGFEKINAPISEIEEELFKNINKSGNIEIFKEKNISKYIREELFNKIKSKVDKNDNFIYSYLLHMRFAKTGFYLQLINDLGNIYNDMVFIIYANDYTVFGSYEDWIVNKKCWGNSIRYIDSSLTKSLEDDIFKSIMDGVIPVVKVGTGTSDDKIDFLSTIDRKISLVEEGDYGAWTKNSSSKLLKLNSLGTIVTSGTGIERASYGKDLDDVFLYDIMDGYMVKSGTHQIYNDELYKNDYINFPDPFVYDINFSSSLQKFQENLTGDSKTKLNKIFKDPNNNSDYIISFFKSVFCIPDVNNLTSFEFYNTRKNSFLYRDDIDGNVSLCSLPSGMRNVDIEIVKEIILSDNELSKKFEIIILSGDETSRKDSEKFTKGRLREFKNNGLNKSVLILASNMGKRSFSISEIKNVFLMFDGGSDTSSEQIIARGMTEGYQYNGIEKKSFNIICCSIDPNRETLSPIDMFLVNKISNCLNRFKMTTEESTRLVLSVFPLNLIDENGIEFNKINFVDFIKRNPKSRMYLDVAKSTIDLELLPDNIKNILVNSGLKSEVDKLKSNTKLNLDGIKTLLKDKKKNLNKEKDDNKELDETIKVLEAILVIIESSFNISLYIDRTKGFSLLETLIKIENDLELKEMFKSDFGIESKTCIFVIESGCINQDLINASIDEQIIEIEYDEL
jgi:hypothetical protein